MKIINIKKIMKQLIPLKNINNINIIRKKIYNKKKILRKTTKFR